jgi:predicted DNA-binding transcriptional regulator AlpA
MDKYETQEARWLRNKQLAQYLGVSAMSLWRWQRDKSLGFPQPTVIRGTSFTAVNEVDAWMRRHITKLAARTR